MIRKMKYLLIATGMLVAGNAVAQYTGPGSAGKLYTCAEIKENASSLDKSDALVQLEGFIIERISKEDYWFQDETGRLLLEINEKDLPDQPFDEKTPLIIIGEVDYDVLEEVEIEVEEIQFK